MSHSLLIVGCGGQGKVVLDCALETQEYDCISFITNDPRKPERLAGYKVYGEEELTAEDAVRLYDDIFVAVGDNDARRSLFESYHKLGASFPSLIHPKAYVSPFAQVGEGTIVMPFAVINSFASVGQGCIINTGAVVEHDCELGGFVHVSPGATIGGGATIGDGSWLCLNSTVSDHVAVASDVILGAGAVLLRDATASGTYVGSPAALKKSRDTVRPLQHHNAPPG